MNKEEKKLNVGDVHILNIGKVAHGGHFIARYNNQVIFVRHAITDEVAKVQVTHVGNKLAFGDAIEILVPSKNRVKSPCQHSKPGGCGGCDFQHISIQEQKNMKQFIIKDQFRRIAQIDINPDIVSAEPYSGLNWRTRLDLSISKNGKAGLYSYKSKNVIEIEECLIAVKKINESKIFKQEWSGEDRLSISVSSENELVINQSEKTILGPDELIEIVDGNIYNISPESFWQSHKNAPSLLVQQVIKYANIKLGDIVCDLYGGAGLFTAPMAKLTGEAGEVHLIERNNYCFKDAKRNFQNKKNITIHHGKVEQKLGNIKNINIVILDPPRNGASKQVVTQIIDKKPRSIVYVSCDPASLARDTKILIQNNYILDDIIGFDLFPMTHHIECVVLFSKRES